MTTSESRIFIVGPEIMTLQMRRSLTATFNELGEDVVMALTKKLNELGAVVKDNDPVDPNTSDYIIYMMDCDVKFEIERLRADLKRLQPVIHPVKKVDFFLCRAITNAEVNYPSLHDLVEFARKEKIFYTTLYHDVPNKFDQQSKYCASRYRKLKSQK